MANANANIAMYNEEITVNLANPMEETIYIKADTVEGVLSSAELNILVCGGETVTQAKDALYNL